MGEHAGLFCWADLTFRHLKHALGALPQEIEQPDQLDFLACVHRHFMFYVSMLCVLILWSGIFFGLLKLGKK